MPPPSPHEPLQLSADDLYSPRVDAFLDEQAMMNRAMPEVQPQPLILRVLYSSYFYLSLASGLGAFLAWLIIEPFIDESDRGRRCRVGLLAVPHGRGLLGPVPRRGRGIMCRNLQRAVICAAVGLAIGFVGGLIAIFPAGIIFVIMTAISRRVHRRTPSRATMPTGLALLVFMMGRAAAWAVAAIPAGIGQGIALRESKVIVNGLLGGVLGGLLGGLLFDPIYIAFPPPTARPGSAAASG